MSPVKIIVIIIFLLILFNLGSALFYMMKDGSRGSGAHMARSLTWRIGLSVAAFLFLLLAFYAGWIEPHGIVNAPPAPN